MFPFDYLSLVMLCISLLHLNGRFVPPLTTLCLFHARFDDRHYDYSPPSTDSYSSLKYKILAASLFPLQILHHKGASSSLPPFLLPQPPSLPTST